MTTSTLGRRESQALNERFGAWPTKLFVLVLFLILSVLMTWPLVLNLRTAVPGPPFDNMVWLYDLWWFRHTIVDLGQWPTINPMIFYPFGYDLRLSETMFANKALIAPFLFWGDEVLAYNALLLISFVLTGYATYLLVAYLTNNRYAAVIAGAILAFCPYRMHAMAAGWLPLISTQWIPLTFLYLERTLRERQARFALTAGLFMALTILSSWYYVYIVGVLAGLFVLVRVLRKSGVWPWTTILQPGILIRNLVLIAVVVGVLVGPVAWPVVTSKSGEMGWALSDVNKWAASAEDFVLPNVYSPFWGEYFLDLRAYTVRYPWYAPGFVYLGISALLLALLGVFKGRKGGPTTHAYVWVGSIALALALGIVLRWNNDTVEVHVPASIEHLATRFMSTLMSKWALHKASYYDLTFSSGTVPVPLPALLVYLFLPLGNAIRTLYRFGVMAIFAVAVLAGVGAARILGGNQPPEETSEAQTPPKRHGTGITLLKTVLVLALVLLDLVSAPLPYGMSEIKAQPLDRWVAAQPDSMVLMQFPLVRALNGNSLYRNKYQGKRMTYGHGTFYPDAYRAQMPVLATFPSEACLDLLKSWGVTHILVGAQAYDAGWGDSKGQSWETIQLQIEASPRLHSVGIIRDEPFWRDERVSSIIYGSMPVIPVVVDQVYVYELQ